MLYGKFAYNHACMMSIKCTYSNLQSKDFIILCCHSHHEIGIIFFFTIVVQIFNRIQYFIHPHNIYLRIHTFTHIYKDTIHI